MTCITPISLKRHGMPIVVPCKKCAFCLQRRRNEWAFRLFEEGRHSESAYFVTLTYDQEHVPTEVDEKGYLVEVLNREDLKRFNQSLNKFQRRQGHPNYKYYAVGEYGTEFDRPHYHLIMFNLHRETLNQMVKTWGKGFVYVGKVTEASIQYTCKYLIDRDECAASVKNFAMMSKGLGAAYLKRNSKWHQDKDQLAPETWRGYVMNNGRRSPMPEYYKSKLFNKVERDLISQENLRRADLNYMEAYERLKHFFDDPSGYIEESKHYKAEQIRVKSKKNRTI